MCSSLLFVTTYQALGASGCPYRGLTRRINEPCGMLRMSHASFGSLAHNSRCGGSPCRKAVVASATVAVQVSRLIRESMTWREDLPKVGEDVSSSPFSRSGSDKPCSTKRAFARKPPLPSPAHFSTKRAFMTRLGSTEPGLAPKCQTLFSKMELSSAFLAPSRNFSLSSSLIFDSLRSASLSFFLVTKDASHAAPLTSSLVLLDLWTFLSMLTRLPWPKGTWSFQANHQS